jgi:autotransporter-associated beta strand protein
MKPKSAPRSFLFLAASSLLAISSASATTYTWTQKTTGTQSWTTAANWDGSNIFVSGASNELKFFLTNTITDRLANNAVITITDVPSTLSMNTLTLSGQGPNATNGAPFTIGTNASTWTLGDGTTSTVNLDSTIGGGGADRDIRYNIAANLTLAGDASGITTFTGASTSGTGALFSGDIGETAAGKGITKSGSSLLVFSGNNSYTGATSVTGGVLRLSSANALSGGIGTTGGTSALTINGGVIELGATDFSRGLGTGSSQFQITGGTSGFSAFGGPRVVTVNGDASQELQWGSAHFQPGTLVLNQSFSTQATVYANDSLELTNRIDLNNVTRTVQVNANKALLSGDIRDAIGSAGLTKTGNGTLVLTGNNTYNGNTTLSAGTLSVETAANFGSGSSGLVMDGGTLQIRGTTLSSISGLGHAVTFNNNAKGFDIQNAAHTFTVNQVLSGTTLLKSGAGTLVLNQNNTFTGATTVTGGGTLKLDYSTNGSKLATAALNLSGGNLVLSGGSHADTVSSIVLAVGTGNAISRESGDSSISNSGGLTIGANSNLTISHAGIVTTTAGNTNGILANGQVTVGDQFGTNDTNVIQAYSIPGANQFTAGGGGGASTAVNQLTGGGTMTGTLTSYALRIASSGTGDTLNLGSSNLTVGNSSTIFYAGGGDNNYTINGTTGRLIPSNNNQDLNINTFTGTTLTVNVKLNLDGSGDFSKAGAGTLVAGGANGYTGVTYVQQGVLRLANNTGAGSTTNGTIVQGRAALELSNGIAVGAEALTIDGAGISNGGALRNYSGSNSYAGAITIGASGARINADTGTTLSLTGGIATTLTQDVTFGGLGNTTVSTAAITGSGAVIKDGAGTLTLSASNTYSGATTVSQGTLALGASGSIANSPVIQVGASGTLDVSAVSGGWALGATQTLTGTGGVTGNATIDGTHAAGNNGVGSQAFANNLSYSSGSIFAWDLVSSKDANGAGGDDGVAGTDFDSVSVRDNIDVASGSIFKVVFGGDALTDVQDTGNAFWNTLFGTQTWNMTAIFGETFNSGAFTSVQTSTDVSAFGSFTINGTSLTWTAIPEPTTALAGLLLGAGLLRRRRK